MDAYLYHRVPRAMAGTVLYPLTVLKQTYPELYAEHVRKYEGREQLLATEVPPLRCLWNDVLHLTAVSPIALKANLAKAGIELPSVAWFEIPAARIQGGNSIAFTYRRDQRLEPDFKAYEAFDLTHMGAYRHVPEETIEYYKQKKAEGVRPLLTFVLWCLRKPNPRRSLPWLSSCAHRFISRPEPSSTTTAR